MDDYGSPQLPIVIVLSNICLPTITPSIWLGRLLSILFNVVCVLNFQALFPNYVSFKFQLSLFYS